MDYLPEDRLHALQLHRLKAIVELAYGRVPLYHKRMKERGLEPRHIQSLKDISLLPLTVKADLRDSYPFGLFAVPMHEIVRLHASSGTTGKPIVVAYTQEDVDVWSSCMVRAFAAYDLHRGDIVQNAYGYGLFTGGLGAHYGAEALGATVVPISSGNTDRQIMIMKDFGSTAICCTPSYFLRLIERAKELDINMKHLPLRAGIFGAEPWTDGMRLRIENESGIKAFDIYGLSEIVGPGVAAECVHQYGLHIFEDHFYPEIIDPDTLEPVPDGEPGELVLTTLSKKAMPMIRYRTRDITSLHTEPCPCGRSIRRMRRISARTDDMLIIRGINIYPGQIEAGLLACDGASPHYQIVLTNDGALDQLEVQVEVKPEFFSDTVGAMEALQRRIEESIERVVNIRIGVRLVEPNTIARSEGKAKRVIDQRKKD
ncbi:MAG: phenylacetate--CoA ligase [Candidatus Hydrogenedentes bacterium]|nr:phenylacetate--CoA ligase [Candidatus Hydrogenedentota bacterium]